MLELFAHPFSSYSWKVLIALYENGTPFTYRSVEDAQNGARLRELWPVGQFPVLVDGDRTVIESSVIIEYLHHRRPGPVALLPGDAILAIETRQMDGIFDDYVQGPMNRIVADAMRPVEGRDASVGDAARNALERIYGWLDSRMRDREWAANDTFSLADCAAAPALFYADWVHPIAAAHPALAAYRRRLLARASIARVVEEARPYRSYFPPGAPDRD